MTSGAPEYFHLGSPESERLHASRAKEAPYEVEYRNCFEDGTHFHTRRTTDLALEVKHNKRDELMISSWMGPRVVHNSITAEFRNREFTGYQLRPATVRFRDGTVSQEYSELLVTGWAGI